MRRLIVIIVLGMIGIIIGGVLVPQSANHTKSAMHTATHTMASTGAMTDMELPDYITNAPQRVYVAYEYAVEHPEDLQYQPCYCGCGNMGHTNNLECYIAPNNAQTGEITFDPHASVCGVCIDITHDVARLKAEGKTPMEIRQYIDATYANVGPSTDTAFPPQS